MKKEVLLLILLVIITTTVVQADSWDDFSNIDRMWDGQKSITNQEFEQVMDKLEEKKIKKEEKIKVKKRKKLFGSGSTLHTELNPDNEVQEFESIKPKDEDLLVNIPVNIIINNSPLEKGFYRVVANKDEKDKKIYINFYQSQFFKGKIEVNETEDDFGEETINFVKILPYNNSFVKIIFGSIEYNAYAYIPYCEL